MGDFFKSATVGYRGSWREGSFPRATAGDLVVSYDQKHHAYRIEAEDHAEFLEWVAGQWEIDNAPQDPESESAADYLDRIGVRIWFA